MRNLLISSDVGVNSRKPWAAFVSQHDRFDLLLVTVYVCIRFRRRSPLSFPHSRFFFPLFHSLQFISRFSQVAQNQARKIFSISYSATSNNRIKKMRWRKLCVRKPAARVSGSMRCYARRQKKCISIHFSAVSFSIYGQFLENFNKLNLNEEIDRFHSIFMIWKFHSWEFMRLAVATVVFNAFPFHLWNLQWIQFKIKLFYLQSRREFTECKMHMHMESWTR